ncbi:GNAT family N-acetyltransferase [Mucilaginibacter agri]|uniref:GNAT family N-acetyltransferase n=1 Tax=Mucilaginibacter agri TaxID=2695265 RepID=A0A966DWY2_9SPHI|nr:GNAT family N-acetyltransferase [Mucilaginibacter agri]NCD71799.1 GNAT family N-acetyltransferase [Mucilaginibacter agri]
MDIKHQKKGDEGFFFVEKDGRKVAAMFYLMENADTMSIFHTGVDDNLQGQHIGESLVEAGVEYARKHHLKVKPACGFAKSIFDKGNFNDVLA